MKFVHSAMFLVCNVAMLACLQYNPFPTSPLPSSSLLLITACQIEYLVDRKLPDDKSAGLVFSSRELERLKNRIQVCL